jgi:hypothetical protein
VPVVVKVGTSKVNAKVRGFIKGAMMDPQHWVYLSPGQFVPMVVLF